MPEKLQEGGISALQILTQIDRALVGWLPPERQNEDRPEGRLAATADAHSSGSWIAGGLAASGLASASCTRRANLRCRIRTQTMSLARAATKIAATARKLCLAKICVS
jgi:hypothetical protein